MEYSGKRLMLRGRLDEEYMALLFLKPIEIKMHYCIVTVAEMKRAAE